MLAYATLGTQDLARAATFYDAVLAPLAAKRQMEEPDYFIAWGNSEHGAGLGITYPFNKEAATIGNGTMVGFPAASHEEVEAFQGLAAGIELYGTQTILQYTRVIGSALAGAVQVLVPRSALLAIGSNPALSIVAMITLAMIVSICSNVDAFFALSFASTFTPGSIVAFLLVGPLVDVKMLALLRTTFRSKVLVGLVVIVVLFAVAVGSVVNLLA